MINNMLRLLCLLFCIQLPFSCKQADYGLSFDNNSQITKKLYEAYSLYIATVNAYKDAFGIIEAHYPVPPDKMHTLVINATNMDRSDTTINSLSPKKLDRFQEFPYIYYEKTVDYVLRKIEITTAKLNTDHTIEQAAIVHCLSHAAEKLHKIKTALVHTPNYYQEKIKTASIKDHFLVWLLKLGAGSLLKKAIPF